MEIAAAFFLIAVLGVFPVIALLVQVYRDSRGKKRNLAMRCYACDSGGNVFPVSHYKGDTFFYCLPCTEKQQKRRRVLGYLATAMIAAVLVCWVILSQG